VPKQRKSNANITLHIQEGIGVCFPNPPQTPPIHRSSFDLDNVLNQFCPAISPPFYNPPHFSRATLHGGAWLHDPFRLKIDIPFIHKDSLLQTFFATFFATPGDFRREKPQRPIVDRMPHGPDGKRTSPVRTEKVMEFCIIKMVS
jgi:hypothetical protein